jgi:thiamine pyrophosphate-dependent acetolactate synthase large subunit-like protein/nitrite reductase/ring-hydroxylating ferredoxin subunit/CDGSH-type Zn-finger protein
MEEPTVAARGPIEIELETGTDYFFCTCGRSQKQPFCDGSHKGSEFRPLKFQAGTSGTAWLCQCKRTGNPPYCDGSHKQLDAPVLPIPETTVRRHWIKVAEPNELQEGEVRTVQAGGTTLALTCFEGKVGALDNACPHQGGPLGEGAIEACWLRCPWHGWDFHPLTGASPEGHGDRVPTYPVEERDDGVFVQVEEAVTAQRTVSDLMVESMVNWGVSHVFGMVGHSNLGLAEAIRKRTELDGLDYIGVRHEGAAAFACSGFAKLSGRPAACLTIAGPGATNLLTGLWDAKVDRAPVLALTGQVNTQVFGPGAFQEVDLASAFAAVSAFSQTVLPGSRHAELMALALKNARVQRDVAHLIFPDEVQVLPIDDDSPATHPDGRLAPTAITPDPLAVDAALAELAGSERPAIVVGYGARDAMPMVAALAEALDAPLLTTFKAKGQVADDHPLAAGVLGRSGTPVASWFMNKADLLLVFGASFANHTGIAANKRIVQVDFEQMALGKFHPVTVPVWGEIGVTAKLLLDRLPDGNRIDPRSELAERWSTWRAEKTRRAGRDRGQGLNSAAVFAALTRQAPDNAVIAVDVGNNTYSFGRYFECRQQRVLMSGYLGSIGFAFPAALGAWAATRACPEHRDRPVLSISGDGGFGQYLGEFTTAVKYGMNITHLLLNNSELGKISKEQRAGQWPVWQTDLVNPDFAAYADLCGGLGLRVTTEDQLDDALERALVHDGPALVEVMTDADLV